MFCCASTWFFIGTLCAIFIPIILTLYLTGNIVVLPEVTKLLLVAVWCYIDALLNLIFPRKCKSIEGLTAVVTGGGHGIGKEIALGFARRGVKVVLWDINEENMQKVADEIKSLNGQAFSYVCDVTDKEKVYEIARKVKDDVGNVDILVNNAGTVVGKNLLSSSDKEIEKTMNINLMAHFWTIKAFLNEMLERDSGHIVAISSILSVLGACQLVDYCTSKSGVSMMMESLRQEVLSQKKHGVHFTTILPSKVNTGLFEGAKGRFSAIPPTIQPEYAANRIIEAIERNEIKVVLPPWFGLILALKPFLPQKLIDAATRFAGLETGMKEFTGHKKAI
ncbi:short-chain dehydrogenase/reductase 3-like [Dendronephthya gigantea]|uniref:short-chain dehydrogenase/reductase 3-like n=1 Tax=Dendronephthya gigantea TaxID=151771 RepID=UPI00106C2032|nr:short-chain dehydrogenase/reductase 3-like [Dendronephthya gigantea]